MQALLAEKELWKFNGQNGDLDAWSLLPFSVGFQPGGLMGWWWVKYEFNKHLGGQIISGWFCK